MNSSSLGSETVLKSASLTLVDEEKGITIEKQSIEEKNRVEAS